MRIKKLLSVICVIVMLLPLLYVPTFAAIEPGLPGAIDYYGQEWQGKNWLLSNMTKDADGNKEQMAFINDSGNLEMYTYNEMSHDRIYAQFPYSVNEDGTISSYDTENQLTFMDDANFDIEFKLRYEGKVFFMTQWTHGAVRLEFKDNRITIDDGNGNRRSIGITDDGKWHTYRVEVRGNNCVNSAGSGPDCIRLVRVYMDGGEIYNFYTQRYPAAYRAYKFYMDNDYDQASWAEVEYVTIENKASTVKIKSHISGDVLEAGQAITLVADAGAADGEKKTVDFYIGGVKVGSGIDQGTITTTTEGSGGGGCEGDGGSSTTTEPAKDASITLSAMPAGTYTVTAVCDGVTSPDVTLFVKNTLAAELNVPTSIESGSAATISVTTSGYPSASRVEYYANSVLMTESNVGGNFEVNVLNLPIGNANIQAKVYAADGTVVTTEAKTIRVTASDVSDITFNREYQLDYTVSDSGTVSVKDGYFELNMTHSGASVSYKDENGVTQNYSGNLGAGSYKVVVTAGNAEVYYNNQFAFAFLMPNCYDAQRVNHSGVENFVFGGSGVKPTYYHKNLGNESEVSEYVSEFGNYFSVEFDKKDASAENLTVYDGLYEIVVKMDSDGIIVNRQPTVGAPTEKYKVADSFTNGYYRITVAEGMAQIFCNNKVLGTWRSPLYSGRPYVSRSVENPSATSFIAIKGIDDIYYHSEDFEGNIEEGFTAEDYWFDETDARIDTEEIEASYKHEIVTENGNSYVKMTGEGTYFLNVMTYNPTFKWRGYFDGTDGEFAIRFRDALKHDYSEISYNVANSQWIAKNSRKTREDFNDVDGDGNTKEIISSTYESQITELATASGTLDSGWHNFELVLNDAKGTLLCDGVEVISADGFRNSFGRIGFRISGGGTLGFDDVEYSGEGRATAGLSYITDGRDGFYRNFNGQIIAATSTSGYSWFTSEDNGVTWTETVNTAEDWIGSRAVNNLNLLSGKFLRVRYGNAKYSYAYLYDETSYVNRNSRAKGTEYTPATTAGAQIEAPGTMDNVPFSGMPSRLMQIQSGPYKGRVIYCRGGSGEIYGRTLMYWSDDYDGVDDPADSTKAVWHEAEIQLSYFNTGHNIQESLMVDMPDGTLRYYVRTEMGHLGYFTSSDGGETWDDPVEMKMENLIAPLCCFSIQRVGDTNTYYAFWEYDLITANLTYIESPRNRRALAVSYDGMQTWEYVADIEEEGLSANSTSSVCNHGMRYLDGAVYMGYYHGNGLSKMFRIDETKMKPLKRFTAPHYRSQEYASVSDFQDQECIIPKTTGEAYVYGNYIHTEVNGNGLAEGEVVAKAVGATYSESGANATLTLGDTTVTFTNGASGYVINGTTVTTDEVCYESSYLNTRIVAELFGKNVFESEEFYVISNVALSADVTNQLTEVESGINAASNAENTLLELVNKASSKNDEEGILAAMSKHNSVLNVNFSTEEVKDRMSVFKRMTGIEYGSVEHIETVFARALEAQKLYESGETPNIALSTPSGGFEKWSIIGKNEGTATVADGIATLNIKSGENAKFAYGIPGLSLFDDEFAFTFDYNLTSGNTDAVVKIGNGTDQIQITINPAKISADLGESMAETEVQLEAGKWYTFKGHLDATEEGKTLTLTVTDGAELNLTICENAAFTATEEWYGFWVEADGATDATVQIKDVRVYKGRAVDIVSYIAEDGKATATVDFLNYETPIEGYSAAETDALWVNESFEEEVNFTDGVRFSRSTALDPAHYTVEVKDGAMHMFKSLDGTQSIEQRILIPTVSSNNPGNDIVFEYDMMIPDPSVWTQTADTAFMYFDIYVNHPVKAMRQTMFIQNDRLKVGTMPYYFKDICGTSSYGGVWMSFKHHYYFENGEWKCNFYYKKQSDSEWTKGIGAMNSSTNKSNFIRFFAYPEDQVEICVDNVKVHNIGEDIHSAQIIMGLYNGDRQAGIGYSDSSNETVGAYDVKRYVLENINYTDIGVAPEAKFFMWNSIGKMVPLFDVTQTK